MAAHEYKSESIHGHYRDSQYRDEATGQLIIQADHPDFARDVSHDNLGDRILPPKPNQAADEESPPAGSGRKGFARISRIFQSAFTPQPAEPSTRPPSSSMEDLEYGSPSPRRSSVDPLDSPRKSPMGGKKESWINRLRTASTESIGRMPMHTCAPDRFMPLCAHF